MSELNKYISDAYRKLDDEHEEINPSSVYKCIEEQGQVVALSLQQLTNAEFFEFLRLMSNNVWRDSVENILSFGIPEKFDINLDFCRYLIKVAMDKYNYSDYLKDLEEESKLEYESEMHEYENRTLKTQRL